MKPDELCQAFIDAGFDTPEKVASLLADLAANLALKKVDIQLDALNGERAAALKPFDDKRIDLTNQKAALILQLQPAEVAQDAQAETPAGP